MEVGRRRRVPSCTVTNVAASYCDTLMTQGAAWDAHPLKMLFERERCPWAVPQCRLALSQLHDHARADVAKSQRRNTRKRVSVLDVDLSTGS
jgi:uncharacterized protein YjiK